MKKLLLPLLIAVICVQLLVPVARIADQMITLRFGEEFRFKVAPIDPYDAFRGKYVNLYARQEVGGSGLYGLIAVGADGFAYVESLSDEKPNTAVYVKSSDEYGFSLPIERYYMDERYAPRAEVLSARQEAGTVTYVTVRIRDGKLVISGLFIDGKAIEDIIRGEWG